jgi:hypothetical protein
MTVGNTDSVDRGTIGALATGLQPKLAQEMRRPSRCACNRIACSQQLGSQEAMAGLQSLLSPARGPDYDLSSMLVQRRFNSDSDQAPRAACSHAMMLFLSMVINLAACFQDELSSGKRANSRLRRVFP